MLSALACALVATVGYGVGTVLQASGARRVSRAEHLDVWLLARLAGQLPYLSGLALDAVGFAAALVALRELPLFVVQAAIAGSLGVTAVTASFVLGVKLGPSDKRALVVLLLGLALLGVSARSEPATHLTGVGGWLLSAGVIVVAAAGVVAARSGRSSGIALAACAGLGFAGTAIAARGLVIPSPFWHVVSDPVVFALVAYGACGILMFASALQRAAVTAAAAMMVVVETVVPAIVGLSALGDRTRPHLEVVAALGFVLAVAASLALSRFTEPVQLIEHTP